MYLIRIRDPLNSILSLNAIFDEIESEIYFLAQDDTRNESNK